MKIKNLKAFLNGLPELDKEDQKKFERDLEQFRKFADNEKNLWD